MFKTNIDIIQHPQTNVDLITSLDGTISLSCILPKESRFSFLINRGIKPHNTYFYYEVKIMKIVDAIGIGFAHESYNLINNMPGWEVFSLGVHSDDGYKFVHQTGGASFSKPWNEIGYVAGVGIDEHGRVFFTLNGLFVGFIDVLATQDCPILYPVIGISDKFGKGSLIELNMKGNYLFNKDKLPPVENEDLDTNHVLCWGNNAFFKMGHPEHGTKYHPVLLENKLNIKSVSAGVNHTLAISGNGQLYSTGDSINFGIGLQQLTFPNHEKLVFSQISAGYSHNLALTDKGELYSWGSNSYGCLGLENDFLSNPTQVKLNSKFKKICAGNNISIALNENGIVYYWGDFASQNGNIPKILQAAYKFKDIAAGGKIAYALSEKGEIYKWEKNNRPIILNDDIKITQISANMSSLAGLDSNGKTFIWSYGQYDSARLLCWPGFTGGQTFMDMYRSEIVADVFPSKVVKVSAGWKHYLLLTDSGDIYCYGYGKYLGLPNISENVFDKARKLEGFNDIVITDIVTGYDNSFAIFKKLDNNWNFDEKLNKEYTWETIGIGIRPAQRLLLKKPDFLLRTDGLEYKKVKNIFENYLHGSDFEITKAFAIKNPILESSFMSELMKLQQKYFDNRDLFISDDWKNMKYPNIRKQTIEEYNNIAEQYHWNKRQTVKIVPVIHGTNDKAALNISASGFSSLARLNEGFYGRGIYFTTYAPYASSYSKDEEKVFVISYILPGNVYPVVEHPHHNDSIKGHPNKLGYQSHYVTVNKKGMPVRDMKNKSYDEIVVFQESQVLPRYVIYAKKKEAVVKDYLIKDPIVKDRHNLEKFVDDISNKFDEYKDKLSYFEKKKLFNVIETVSQWLIRYPNDDIVIDQYKKLKAIIPLFNMAISRISKEEISNQQQSQETNEDNDESSNDTDTPADQPPQDQINEQSILEESNLNSYSKEQLIQEILRLKGDLTTQKNENFRLKTKINFILSNKLKKKK